VTCRDGSGIGVDSGTDKRQAKREQEPSRQFNVLIEIPQPPS